jgi:hypothetical protein
MEKDMAEPPKVVCMSGSSRFVDKMAILAWEMEKRGMIVLGLHLLPHWYKGVHADHQAEAEGVREAMDELHLRKIDLADEVFVYNEEGYIGDSTRKEITYAETHEKPVRYLESVDDPSPKTWRDDEQIKELMKDGVPCGDILVIDCPFCGSQSYYSGGFTSGCSFCGKEIAGHSDEAYTVTDAIDRETDTPTLP